MEIPTGADEYINNIPNRQLLNPSSISIIDEDSRTAYIFICGNLVENPARGIPDQALLRDELRRV